ncbi:hypothetical protein BH11PSE2_BH11PSE2_06140 [soil metagenome]
MLFLMNDVVLTLDSDDLSSAGELARTTPMRFDFVSRMGQELYAEDPLLHRNHLARAKRLASLILLKAPEVNAALFLAPTKGCSVSQVSYRFAQVDFEVICGLQARQASGALTTLDADRQVWKRLAA